MSVFSIQKTVLSNIEIAIQLNGSKSISNRVLIIDAICQHQIPIENLSNADDTVFLQRILQSNESVLDAGAGGTTFRFLTAFLATQEGRECVLTGSERMQQRPIRILVDALRQLGADISYENQDGFPPLRIRGKKIKGGKISLPEDTSYQYITALLLIAPTLEEGLELELIGTIVSVPYIKMTLKMMEYFGVTTSFIDNKIVVKSGNYQPRPFFVEGDWSAASYFYSIAVLASSAKIELQGLTNQQIQGDSVIASIASNFGIETIYKEKSIELIKKHHNTITSFSYDFLECPDLAQTVVAFCAASKVEMHCNGLQTLRIKETDRINALDVELRKLGLATLTEVDVNHWHLQQLPENTIDTKNVTIDTYEDHRMAMSFAPLALSLGTIRIAEPNVVTKSYPLFWEDLKKMGFVIATTL
ncbi:MAG: hypothetical protein R2807_04260 [Chitinophagales bacterium]